MAAAGRRRRGYPGPVRALLVLCLAAATAPDQAHSHGRLLTRPHAPAAPARQTGTMPLGLGDDRDGFVFVPASYDPARPAPLLVLLHGAHGSAERIFRHFRDAAD